MFAEGDQQVHHHIFVNEDHHCLCLQLGYVRRMQSIEGEGTLSLSFHSINVL